ncbi:hypothetical protein B0O80DRAFT_445706 [Mortierella sp. GBAus27b]|nr:hypothetical protein BGX31_009873 [Mortierella sp. GBA43]KAI8357738.1 hypothetical protein B0O80DRAFT_445706 [Mortierella sp. GBAus27b]
MMRNSILLLATLLVALVVVSAQTQTPLPCYEEKCNPLISVLKDCQITVDTSGDKIKISFPNTTTPADTDKCICKQSIVDAYDPCINCGVENQKVNDRYVTQKLVDSCNAAFGAGTVKMPSAAASSAIRAGSLALAVASVVFSVVFLA